MSHDVTQRARRDFRISSSGSTATDHNCPPMPNAARDRAVLLFAERLNDAASFAVRLSDAIAPVGAIGDALADHAQQLATRAASPR